MAAAAVRLLGSRVSDGIVVAPAPLHAPAPLEALAGGHPTPTRESERAGRRALAIARATGARRPASSDLRGPVELLVLISGGASSLMVVPADGVTRADKCRTSDLLLRSGADIHALNAVRKHLSDVKGGWLAAKTSARCLTLGISDVVGDDLSVIGSGPTVGDATTFRSALDALQRRGGADAYPVRVIARLRRGAAGKLEETPKPGDVRLARSEAFVIGGRQDAMRGATAEAGRRGYHPLIVDEAVTGEARLAARALVETIGARITTAQRPVCVVASGETTVSVRGSGRGGRNQEFALAVADMLPSLGRVVAAASVGTDGVDGPTDAAGAIADSTTMERATRAGLAPQTFLEKNDAYAFFHRLRDLVRTGPTGTNVGDLQLFLLA